MFPWYPSRRFKMVSVQSGLECPQDQHFKQFLVIMDGRSFMVMIVFVMGFVNAYPAAANFLVHLGFVAEICCWERINGASWL